MVMVIFLSGIMIYWLRGICEKDSVSYGGWNWCLNDRVGGDWICPKGSLVTAASECQLHEIDVELFSEADALLYMCKGNLGSQS